MSLPYSRGLSAFDLKIGFYMSRATNSAAFNGYELAFVVGHSRLSRSTGHILAQCANLAACTSDYFIHKSHRSIAEETGYSVSTVLRAFREAVSRGLLSCTVVVDERTNARKANLYRFTPGFLAFVSRVKEKLISAGLKISSPVRKLKQLVDQVFALCPPCQNEHPSPCQNDRAKNKRTSSRTTKRDIQGKSKMPSPVVTNKQLSHAIAASKAAAANKRTQLVNQYRNQQREVIERLARKYAYLQHKRDKDLPGISDFSNEPRTGRLKDAIDTLARVRRFRSRE
ncbi:Replication protein repL [Enterobacter asburiae]|uniref:Replication protein repL n=1 Tax=Enterobacter asburiae TaxID=61645 RepID=UPI002003DC5D|nr:Replication protein repL [Enterobacter asburiae]MCK7247697.1 Replication protein repL [Enterobacter asburiae]